MPDVGVLNLQIHDNSETAVAGLDKLVGAMTRVKNAVGNGMNLGGMADGLKKLCKVVDDELHGSTIAKLFDLADSLQKLKNAGGSISSISKLAKIGNGFSTASEQVETLKETVNEVKNSVAEGIKIPIKTVVDNSLKDIYLNEKGNLMGNTPEVPALTAKYRALPDRTFEDYYEGMRWKRDTSTGEDIKYQTKDLMSEWLHGNGTENEQLYAIQQMAQTFGMSVDEVRQRISELRGETDSATSSVNGLNTQTTELSDKAEKASWSLSDLKNKIGGLKKASGSGVFTKLLSSFARIVKYRILRSVIKHITSGFSDGLQNVYNYSKAIGNSFAPSMDSAATALATFKNAVGAAAAPLIEALIPFVNIAVNAIINLVNWANQFVALLRGQSTWTRALTNTTNAFDKQTKAAKKTGSAIKDLLADWDELNIIQSQSSGGSADTATNYLEMFEQVSDFSNDVKKVVDFLKDNMDDILNIAKKIGLAILAWKASSLLTCLLSDLFALTAAGLIIGITWDITTLLDRQYMKTGDAGWLVADALTNLLGATLAGTIVAKVLGGAAGLVTAGIELTVSAGISYGIAYSNEDQDRAQALKDLAAIKAAIGYAAMAVGFGIASGSAGIGMLVAAEVAAPLFVLSAAVSIIIEQYRSAEEIAREAFAGTGEGGIKVDEVFKALQDELNKATEGYSLVIEAFSGAEGLKTDLAEAFETVSQLSAVVRGDGKLTQKEAEDFKKAWETVFSAFEGLAEKSFDTVFAGLNKSLSSENEEIREQAKQLRISLLMMQENLSEAMAEFKLEQQDLAEKIGKGTATSEEVETYFRNLELVAKSSRTSLTDLQTVLSGRETIDFGDSEHAVENAVQFIKDAQEASTKAIEEINEGYKSEMDALDILWSQTELAHSLGKISDEQFAVYQALFDDMRENFTTEANAEKQKVTDDVQAAYTAVIEQAMSGLANVPGLVDEKGNMDYIKLAAYMTEIMLPILSAAKDAGAEFSEDFGKMFAMGVNLKDWIGEGWAAKLEEYVRQEVLGMDIGKSKEIEVPVEVTPKTNISDWKITDEINEALWDADGQVTQELLQNLADTYGLDMQGVLDRVQYDWLDDDTIESLRTVVDLINETSGLELKLPDVKDDTVAKDTEAAAEKYESMASRIRAAFKSLDGLGFNLSFDGMNGNMTVTLPQIQTAATGAFVRSGDLVMANENGQFEMMGQMGNQPVIANNQQIVEGISLGVGNANSELASEIRGLRSDMQKVANRPIVIKYNETQVGRSAVRGMEAYDRIIG